MLSMHVSVSILYTNNKKKVKEERNKDQVSSQM